MTHVTIEVRGGVVVEVTADEPCEVLVVDHDNPYPYEETWVIYHRDPAELFVKKYRVKKEGEQKCK